MIYQGWMWFILMISGAIAGTIMGKKELRKREARTFAGKLLSTLWFASGIAMFMLGFFGPVTNSYDSVFICPIISTVLGLSYFVSGAIQQNKWFQYLSIGWWLGAALLFIFPGLHVLLVFAGMLILFQALPGIILYRKWKREMESV